MAPTLTAPLRPVARSVTSHTTPVSPFPSSPTTAKSRAKRSSPAEVRMRSGRLTCRTGMGLPAPLFPPLLPWWWWWWSWAVARRRDVGEGVVLEKRDVENWLASTLLPFLLRPVW